MGPLVVLAFMVLFIAAMWKVFTKAGHPGWAAIVPIYNAVIMCRIAGKPGWWVLLMLIPLVGWIIGIMVAHGISKAFGFGVGMTLLQIFLPIVAWPILAWGEAAYEGGAAEAA